MASYPSPIVAVFVVARDDTPLFFRHFLPAAAPAAPPAAESADGADDGDDLCDSEEAAAVARLQLAAYASLDLLEEKARPVSFPPPAGAGAGAGAAAAAAAAADGGGAATRDPFLGLLLPVDDMKVFGYASGTQARILVVMRDVLLREDRVRELFRGLHRLYVDAVCSPFSPAGAAADAQPAAALAAVLGGARFGAAVARLCESTDVLYRGPIPA
jgi:hypothetical protein